MPQQVVSCRGERRSTSSSVTTTHLSSSHTTGTEPGNESRHNTLDSDNTSGFDILNDFDDDLLFLSSLYTRARSHCGEDSFCLSPPPNTLSSPTASFCTPMPGTSGKDTDHPSKVTKRQAQNREAQRRFRERREQERTHLLNLLQKLGAEKDRISNLLEQTREKYLTLEARTKQLQTEADILRRWRQEMMSSMAGLIQQPELAEEVLEVVAGSCSYSCWRRGIQRSRAFIALQTLAGLFAGVEECGLVDVGPATTTTTTMTATGAGEGISGMVESIHEHITADYQS